VAASQLSSHLALVGARDRAADALAASERGFERALRLEPRLRLAERWLVALRHRRALGRGIALLHAGRGAAARAELYRAIELLPESPLPRYWLGVSLDADGRPDDARKAFREAVDRFERHADSWWYLADLAASEGDLEEARRCLERARAIRDQAPFGQARRERLVSRLGAATR
jgi:tetratricopeptide (TPR) repeat protein